MLEKIEQYCKMSKCTCIKNYADSTRGIEPCVAVICPSLIYLVRLTEYLKDLGEKDVSGELGDVILGSVGTDIIICFPGLKCED